MNVRTRLLLTLIVLVSAVGGAVFHDSVVRRSDEARFLDECVWGPPAVAVSDPSGHPGVIVPPRQQRNPFPLCYLELQKARQPQITFPTVTPSPAAPPVAPPVKP